MITPFKNRNIDLNIDVSIYRNLLKKGVVFSVKQYGYVVAHTTSISLINCTCVVNYVAQQRIRKTKNREVHAHITGTITEEQIDTNNIISYQPFVHDDFFVISNTHEKLSISGAEFIKFGPNGLLGKNIKLK